MKVEGTVTMIGEEEKCSVETRASRDCTRILVLVVAQLMRSLLRLVGVAHGLHGNAKA